MDRTTLGRTMLPLQRDGLIAVKISKSDRRGKELQLTESGAIKLGIARELWNVAQTRFEKEFGSERSSILRKELRTVISIEL
jgi:DNA-binding MarR family transcriptional regulator